MAPERRLPAAASALTATVEGPAVTLTWANPDRRVDGTALRDLETIRVFRRVEEPGTAVKPAMLSRGRVAGYEQIASIRGDAPPPPSARASPTGRTCRTDSATCTS